MGSRERPHSICTNKTPSLTLTRTRGGSFHGLTRGFFDGSLPDASRPRRVADAVSPSSSSVPLRLLVSRKGWESFRHGWLCLTLASLTLANTQREGWISAPFFISFSCSTLSYFTFAPLSLKFYAPVISRSRLSFLFGFLPFFSPRGRMVRAHAGCPLNGP